MYNRYIRNDRGTYTRISEEDGTSRAPAPPNPPGVQQAPPPDVSQPRPPHRPPPEAPENRPPLPPDMSPPPPPRIQDGFFRHLLDVSRLENVDSGDLLLLCLLFLLYREGADEELLVALGLLLIL